MNKFKKITNIKAHKWLLNIIKPYTIALAFILVLNVIIALSSVGEAIVSRQMIDIAVSKNFGKAMFFVLLFTLLILLQVAFNALIPAKTTKLSTSMTNELQQAFMKRYFRINWLSLNKYHSGDVLTRLTSDIENITEGIVSLIPDTLALAVQLVAAFITLMFFDKTLALFAFVLGPVSVILSYVIGRRLKKYQHHIQAAESQSRAYMNEAIQNNLIIKTFEHEDTSLQKIRSYQQEKYKWIMKKMHISVTSNIVLGLGYRLGFILAFIWGAYRLSKGLTTFGTFTAFLQLVVQVQFPFHGLAYALNQYISVLTSTERIIEFENLETEDIKKRIPYQKDSSYRLVLQNLSFSYISGQKILDHISITIEPGSIVAIVGESGQGKTTLFRILLSLINSNSGNAYFEDNNGNQIPISPSTRSLFSYVPQGDTLFSGTIAENLLVGNPNSTEDELIEACKISCSWQFIEPLPVGIHTVIGEHGIGLSEGQAQRIAIARALLRDSPILLFDEATSSLDIDTEHKLLENIRNLKPKNISINITHRKSIIDNSTQIIRIND